MSCSKQENGRILGNINSEVVLLVLNYHETDTSEFNFYYLYSNNLFTNSCKQERIDKVYKYIVY